MFERRVRSLCDEGGGNQSCCPTGRVMGSIGGHRRDAENEGPHLRNGGLPGQAKNCDKWLADLQQQTLEVFAFRKARQQRVIHATGQPALNARRHLGIGRRTGHDLLEQVRIDRA